MNRLLHIGLASGLAFLSIATSNTTLQAQVLAFPEAEGFGKYATGARTNLSSATVYHVTNLNDSGPGSFRDAVSQSNRFVVFDVGGIANIDSVIPVKSNITIAGQTAPGGFTLYSDRISFTGSSNLISRHFAVRKGAASGRTDTASIARGTNMIFDHMSFTWGVDANFDINPDSGFVIDDITIQNSIVGQGLDNVGHSTGGLMQPGSGGSVSVIKSLYADNVTRNPKVRYENEFINNVVYGWETAAYIMGDTNNADSHANVEGNYFIEGPINGGGPFNSGTSRFNIFADDNWVDTDRDGVLNGALVTSYPGATVVGTRHNFPTTTTMTAQQAVTHVMENAGPNIVRDVVDQRMMDEVASYGTLGGVIERESHLFPNFGSDPTYLNPRARLVDGDNDGVADNWENNKGLNPSNGSDWKQLNASGYTRLEEYVNELGADGALTTSNGGNWTSPATWNQGLPKLADEAIVVGNLTVNGGQGFARRLNLNGSLTVTSGTVDVFDTATITGTSTISGGTVTAGRLLLGSTGQSATLNVHTGATLRSATIASNGGGPSLSFNGGIFQSGGLTNIQVATSLGASGATIDTDGFDATMSGPISGAGGLTKQGDGELFLGTANTYNGPTNLQQGQLRITSSAALQSSSAIHLTAGTQLNVSSIPGGYIVPTSQVVDGSGQIQGDVQASAGSVIRPVGGEFLVDFYALGIQAEDLSLTSDWAVFSNALHGTGNGGSYSGSDLNGGGIVMVNNQSLSGPASSGLISTTVDIPESGTWYLFARVAEPSTSVVLGDEATHAGGNNSLWVSASSSNLQTTTSNFDEVQTPDNAADLAKWVKLSPTLSALSGVSNALNNGINYDLSSGTKTFAIGGREVGTVLDGFVLANENLTAAQLDEVLNGTEVFGTSTGMTITGSFTQQSGSLFEIDLSESETDALLVGGTATLAGELSVNLLEGYLPESSDSFTILTASTLLSEFANASNGSRINTTGVSGSFLVTYNYTDDIVQLSDFQAGTPGDFDGDGDVDGQDFLALQRLGSPTATNIAAWQQNYGAGSPGFITSQTTTIPEPSILTLFLLATGTNLSLFRKLRSFEL